MIALFVLLLGLNSWSATCRQASVALPEIYSKAMPEVVEFHRLVENLRTRQDITYKTHIPEFVQPTENLIAFAKTALNLQKSPDIKERRRQFEKFEREAQAHIKNDDVHYQWWLLFHIRLSILLTPEAKRSLGTDNKAMWEKIQRRQSWLNHEDFTAHFYGRIRQEIYQFPKTVVFPTTMGTLGVSAMNYLAGTKVHAFGIIADPVQVDGRLMYPDRFMRHELVHFERFYSIMSRVFNDEEKNVLEPLRNRYFESILTLSLENRIKLDYFYFVLTFENPSLLQFIHDKKQLENYFQENIKKFQLQYLKDPHHLQPLLPEALKDASDSLIENFIDESLKLGIERLL